MPDLQRTLEEHFEIITRAKSEIGEVLTWLREMHEAERHAIDALFARMNILAFGTVGAVIALNAQVSVDNALSVFGMTLLIGNALWSFFVHSEQGHINRDTFYNRAEMLNSELVKLIDAFHDFVDEQTPEKEQALMVAKANFSQQTNDGAFFRAPQNAWSMYSVSKHGYFVIFALGLLCILLGFIFPVSITEFLQ